ncbi:MAG: hypothetical protein AB7W47_08805 [Calditrichaceae bacterium]
MNNIPGINYLKENYRLTENEYDSSIEIKPIIDSLKNDTWLPKKRKQNCIDILQDIKLNHDKVVVFESVNKISFDFTIKIDSDLFFFELHEDQHKKLKVNRQSKIFDIQGNEIFVPRYLQRLLKDIWRWENLDNYKIIWADWFISSSNKLSNLLEKGKIEYGIDNTFQFKNLGI